MPTQVSICIPAFNAGRTISETLRSVQAQSFKDWELLVVEDGSNDGTEAIVKSFAASVGGKVRYIRHERNKGLPAARNTAIGAAHGDWIALLDSDDVWDEDHLQGVMEFHEANPHAEFIYSAAVEFESETGIRLNTRAPTQADLDADPLSLYVGTYTIQPSAVVAKRSLFLRTGGFAEDFLSVEDREYWVRLVRAGAQLHYNGQHTCNYRIHGAAMTRNAPRMAEYLAHFYAKNADWDAIPERVRFGSAAAAWIAAGRLVRSRDPQLAVTFSRRALRYSCTAQALLYTAVAYIARFGGFFVRTQNLR